MQGCPSDDTVAASHSQGADQHALISDGSLSHAIDDQHADGEGPLSIAQIPSTITTPSLAEFGFIPAKLGAIPKAPPEVERHPSRNVDRIPYLVGRPWRQEELL